MDVRIQQSVVANLSRRPLAIESGPFVLGLDPGTASPWVNYATPLPGAVITAGDVAKLVAAFRTHERVPRLEYVVPCAPELEALLVDAGFGVEARHQYLVCGVGALVVPADVLDFDLHAPRDEADRKALAAALGSAFGDDGEPSEADVARIARVEDAGGVVLMAVAPDGTCAGGGQASAPYEGVSEVAGIGVREQFRRRGLGAAITAGVTAHFFAGGGEIAWLEAGSEDSWRVYERIGFRPAGNRLYISQS